MIFASGSFEKHMSGTSPLHFTSYVVHFHFYTYVHEASPSWFLWDLIPVEKPRGKISGTNYFSYHSICCQSTTGTHLPLKFLILVPRLVLYNISRS